MTYLETYLDITTMFRIITPLLSMLWNERPPKKVPEKIRTHGIGRVKVNNISSELIQNITLEIM